MKDRRIEGQSQLDYLWVTYGGLTVTNTKITEDLDSTLPTYSLVKELINKSSGGTDISGLILDNSTNLLHIKDSEGTDIGEPVDLSKYTAEGKSISDFGITSISQDDIDAGCSFPIGTICAFIQVGDLKYYTPTNNSSNSISSYIEDGILKSKLVIDNSGNVQLSISSDGVKAELPIINLNFNIEFEYLESDPTEPKDNTVYFIKNKPYFFFGNNKISGDITWKEN